MKKFLSALALVCAIALPSRAQIVGSSSGTAGAAGVIAGSQIPTLNGANNFTLVYTPSGAPASLSIQIEGSSNGGSSYSICGSAATVTNSTTTVTCSGTSYDHVQVNLTTLSGGSSPTVTWQLTTKTAAYPQIASPSASSFSSDAYTQSVFSNGNSYDIFGCLNVGDNVCVRVIMQSNSAAVLTTAISAYNAYTGTGTNALVIGMEGFPQNVSSGTVTDMPAVAGQCGNAASGTGTITRCEAYYAYPCTNNAGAGTIQTCIGVYILPQTLGTSANYAILTQGGTNSFGDNTNVLQQTAATSGTNQNSPTFSLIGNYWTGAASANDIYIFQDVALSGGANPAEILNLTHSGSSGALFFQMPSGLVLQWSSTSGSIGASGGSNNPANIYTSHYNTTGNCASSGGTCGSSTAGHVSIAAAATTVTVSTTAVTANSDIQVSEDMTVGGLLSVTCNTTQGRTYSVTTRTAGTSFVITTNSAPAANPACLTYTILN